MNGTSHIDHSRIRHHKMSRYNPIRNLTPQLLTQQIDWFDAGQLSYFARTMDAIAERDDNVKGVVEKRKSAVKRMNWEIIVDPDAPKSEAEAHRKVLNDFYKNLIATDAVDRDQLGGFTLLIDQMMNAVGYKYHVHELLWRPDPTHGLSCTFNSVPLWFFENQNGQMKFLRTEGLTEGEEMKSDEWMVTCGKGLMRATSVAYMYKILSLKDWVLYNEKHGMPGVLIKTKAPYGSPQWDACQTAAESVSADFAGVMGFEDEMQVVQFGGQGQLPYPLMVDRMDKFVASLWRGGNLGTMSANVGGDVGASTQKDETANLELDDAQWLSETLQMKIDRLVLEYYFGKGVKPLAYVKICPVNKKDVGQEIAVDQFLLGAGGQLGKKETYERYNRPMPKAGDDVLERQMLTMPGQSDDEEQKPRGRFSFANELRRGDSKHALLIQNAKKRAWDAQAMALEPLWERLDALMELARGLDEKAFLVAAQKFLKDLPEIQREIARNPEGARAFEAVTAAGLFNGLTEATVARN